MADGFVLGVGTGTHAWPYRRWSGKDSYDRRGTRLRSMRRARKQPAETWFNRALVVVYYVMSDDWECTLENL